MQTTGKIREKLKDKIVDWYEHSPRRMYFSVAPAEIKEVAEFLFKDLGLRFCTASGIDTPSGFEILYHFSHDKTGIIYSVRVLIENREKPEIESITSIIIGAEWIEREMWELLGINFKNHPNLQHLVLSEDWPEGEYPLRQKTENRGQKTG